MDWNHPLANGPAIPTAPPQFCGTLREYVDRYLAPALPTPEGVAAWHDAVVAHAARPDAVFLVRAWVIPQSQALVLRVKAAAPPPTTLLAPAEERALYEAIASDPSWEAYRDGLMVRLMIATGLRVSSVVALNASDLDLAYLRLTAPTKGGRRITVAVERTLLAALLGLAGGREGALFTSKTGGRLTVRQVQVRLHRWVDLAVLRSHITPHALRHTFGTRLYAETKDLRRVQVALGHRSVTTTERYVAVG